MVWLTPEERLEDLEKRQARMLDVSMNSVRWERQTKLLEIFKNVGHAEKGESSRFDLPSHGNQYDDCGKTILKGCIHVEDHPSGKVFGRLFKRSCARASCPECYEAWSGKEGMKGLIKIASYSVGHFGRRAMITGSSRKLVVSNTLVGFGEVERLIHRIKYEWRKEPSSVVRIAIAGELEDLIARGKKKVIHLLVSPPQNVSWDNLHDFKNCRSSAYRIASESGFQSGACIPHPYRMKCVDCGHHPIDDYSESCPKCGGITFQWYFSPHFHMVGYGWIENTGEGFQRHGWIVKNLGVRKSVFWTFEYLLSHAGIRKGIHTVTWFGGLSSNRMEKCPSLGKIHEICRFCERPLIPLEWIGGIDRPPPEFEYDKKNSDLNELSLEPGDWRVLHG